MKDGGDNEMAPRGQPMSHLGGTLYQTLVNLSDTWGCHRRSKVWTLDFELWTLDLGL